MIVTDIGCARYGDDYSIDRLIEEFNPDVLYGFDPNPAIWNERRLDQSDSFYRGTTKVILVQAAAWTLEGEIGFREDGLRSWVVDSDAPQVRCFDLARHIEWCSRSDSEQVLKIDAEGSEYDLLGHLIIRAADRRLSLALVEWHTRGIDRAEDRRRVIEAEIHCPIREWPW